MTIRWHHAASLVFFAEDVTRFVHQHTEQVDPALFALIASHVQLGVTILPL